MDVIRLEARAKINLSLDVTGKRPDGYHDVRMIMQTIGLHDKIIIRKREAGIFVTSNSGSIPVDESNTAYKAARLFLSAYGIGKGVDIHIEKSIPVSAGLAGGSTDAASVLKGLNRLFSVDASQEELAALGLKVGADVPFCVYGGTMLAEGIGEKLTGLPPLPGTGVVLVKPPFEVSTPWVYRNLDFEKITERPDMEKLLKAIGRGDIEALASGMVNVLETVTAHKYPVIREIKELLIEHGALGSVMTGSGPTVFGIFKDHGLAEKSVEFFKGKGYECCLTNTA